MLEARRGRMNDCLVQGLVGKIDIAVKNKSASVVRERWCIRV